jgi:hypothetical protein
MPTARQPYCFVQARAGALAAKATLISAPYTGKKFEIWQNRSVNANLFYRNRFIVNQIIL